MNKATLTSKGQLTVPREVRERLGLKAGDRLLFDIEGDTVRLRVIQRHTVADLFERLPGSSKPYPGREAEREAARRVAAGGVLGRSEDEG